MSINSKGVSLSRRLWMLLAIAPIAIVAILLTSSLAGASHGNDTINLTTAGATATHNDAVFLQGGSGAGTGNFNPFLTLSQSGNADVERGYNTTAANGEFDTFFGGGRTVTLKASAIPTITHNGGRYREFSLDANDSGADDYMSIEAFDVFVTTEAFASAAVGSIVGSDAGTGRLANPLVAFPGQAELIYSMGNSTVYMRSQGLTPGSGVSDITILVPDSSFPADCYYGATDCDQWVVLYTASGYAGSKAIPGAADTTVRNWNVTAGFEEWQTRLLPVVEVSKTVNVQVTRTYQWDIEKSVTPAIWNLFDGESGTSAYTVEVENTGYTEANPIVSGTISIKNPTGDANVIPTSIPAVITSVTDVLKQGAVESNANVSCPVSFPYSLAAGATLNCTYTIPTVNGGTDSGTNTAKVALQGTTEFYTGTAALDFANATVGTEVNKTVNVTDSLEGALGTATAPTGATFNYTRTFECEDDEGVTGNTATITQTGQNDSAAVTVNCYDIAVSKTATTSLTRTYNWTIDKTVTPDAWDLFAGESGTSEYTVTLTKTGSTDSAWAASGSITVSNVGNPIPAVINSVSDVITGGINGVVDCGATVFPHTIAAGATLVCSYSATLPDGTTRTNTATAVQQLYDYDENLVATADGTSNEPGTAPVNFAAATVTDVNASVNVTDTYASAGPWLFNNSGFVSYSRTFTCDADEGTKNNTATITETGQNDSASVDVDCYDIAVTKDATTTFQRQYFWDILKSSNDPNGDLLLLAIGQTYVDYPYDVRVSVTSYTDSLWAVSGNITVSNAGNPIPATINSVSDIVSPDIAATVECGVAFPYTIAAGGSLNCTYSTALPDGTNRTNTATAVQQLFSYDKNLVATPIGTSNETGNANVTFGAPTTLVDEEITVTDTYAGLLGTATVAESPKTFSYNRTFGPFTADECGDTLFENTASFVTYDTGGQGSSSWDVTVRVDCPQGCTLTQGYWKTHSVYGPAPYDDTWDLLDEDGQFFTSGLTNYVMFWTAPKGGNAYIMLAHQYLAAQLNFLNDADPSAAQVAFDAATALFNTYSSSDFDSLKGKNAQLVRAEFINLAGILASYNEGAIGPGHCSEDGLSAAN